MERAGPVAGAVGLRVAAAVVAVAVAVDLIEAPAVAPVLGVVHPAVGAEEEYAVIAVALPAAALVVFVAAVVEAVELVADHD